MREYSLIFIVLFLFKFAQQTAFSGEFVVEGTLSMEAYANGKVQLRMSREFKGTFDNSQFEITARFDDTTNSMTYVFDGQNLYKMLLSQSSNKAEFLKRNPHGVAADGIVDLIKNGLPVEEDGSYIQIIWLAYASQHYFGALSNSMAKPIWTLDDPKLETNGFAMSVAFSTNADQLGLPKEIDYLSDGVYRGYDWDSKTETRQNYPPPFDKGFTNAIYRVTAQKNVAGNSVPTDFEFTTYSAPLNGALLPRCVFHGHATSIYRPWFTKEIKPPSFKGVVQVHDYRRNSALWLNQSGPQIYPFSNYYVTNGDWSQ